MKVAQEMGVEVPKTLEGWADYFPRYTTLPWLKGKDHTRLQVTRDYLRLAFDRIPIAADTRGPITRLVQKAISMPARWRPRSRCVQVPGRDLAQQQTQDEDGRCL